MVFISRDEQTQGKAQVTDLWDVPSLQSVEQLVMDIMHRVGWGPLFLTHDGQPRWERIVASGHSQGAGHATYLSVMRRTRAVILSGPQDCSRCAEWLSVDDASLQDGTMNPRRRALFHADEECVLGLLDKKCPKGEDEIIQRNLARIGLETTCVWHEDEGVGQGCEVVVSKLTPTCRHVRAGHASTGTDECAAEGMDRMWKWIFAEVREGEVSTTAMPRYAWHVDDKMYDAMMVMLIALVALVLWRTERWRARRGDGVPLLGDEE